MGRGWNPLCLAQGGGEGAAPTRFHWEVLMGKICGLYWVGLRFMQAEEVSIWEEGGTPWASPKGRERDAPSPAKMGGRGGGNGRG